MTGLIFTSLPTEFQQILHLIQEQQGIEANPLAELKGGQTGARLFLVSVTPTGSKEVAHLILKLDHVSKRSESDEITRHRLALSQAPPDFARQHMPEIAYDLMHEGCTAIFYSIAGQSLLNFHPLSSLEGQNQLERIFQATNDTILSEWNRELSIEQTVHPQELLKRWLGYRLSPQGNTGRFLEETLHIPQDTGGLLIDGELFPNPLAYGQSEERWGSVRAIDIINGFQHGDLNTGNILVKFAANERDLEGYFLIDFALYKNQMPLLYDQRYLELSYLLHELERLPFEKWVTLVARFAGRDLPGSKQVPVELAGSCGVINAGRRSFKHWIENYHPSLGDDLWGQFWLAGAAAGINFCNKPGISDQERLGGLVYGAAHLKRFCGKFGVPWPGDVAMLYDASQGQTGVQAPAGKHGQALTTKPPEDKPSGTVTFLFTDIVGSTALWEANPREMVNALALHDELLEKVVLAHHGHIFKRVGDAFCVAFHSAIDALEAAAAGQRVLNTTAWEKTGPLAVRMGLHSGLAVERDGDYFGPVVNRVARLHAIAHGGQILVSQATYELARDQISAEYRWLDLGRCPLKGLSRPEHVFQLTAPDLETDFPPLAGQDHPMSSLPEQATSFVGRHHELSQVISLLEKHRLVTLSGPGGIGKTRLAIATAEGMQGKYRHGVHFVPLLPLNSATAITPAIANVLGIGFLEGRSPEEQLLDHVRSMELLLVLDNMEHLLVEGNPSTMAKETVSLIERMLTAAPDLTLLVTSRELLRLPQEKAYVLEGLPLGYSTKESDYADEGAAELFLQRAQRLQPSFRQISSAELQQVYEICHLVEGMPLAIELAAAQLRLLSMGEILGGIKENLDVFSSGLRGASARHGSMLVVFESSWNSLGNREQLIFARLSVFRGGFTRQAATKVAGATVVELAALLDKSLIRRNADGRFDMHALIHLFVSEKLTEMPGELALARDRHQNFYRILLQDVIIRWQATYDPAVTDALIPEVENMRDGWGWTLGQGDWETTSDYLDNLWQFFKIQGRLTEAIELLTQTQLAGQTADPPANVIHQAHWERLLGQAYLWLSKLEKGADHFCQTLVLLGSPFPQRNTGLLAGTLVEIALQALHRAWPGYFIGRLADKHLAIQESIFAYEKLGESNFAYSETAKYVYGGIRSLNQAEAIGVRPMMARAYATAGFMTGLLPVHRVAQTYLNWAEDIAGDEPSPFVREWVSRLSGFYWTGIGQFERAETHFTQAANAASKLGQYWNLEFNWVGLFFVTYNKGEFDRSLAYAQQIGASASKRGDAGYEAAGSYWQALTQLRRGGDVGRIIDLLQESASAPGEVMNIFDWFVVCGAMAQAYLRQGHDDFALEEAQKVLRLAENIPFNVSIGNWHGYAEVVEVIQILWEKYRASDMMPALEASVRQARRDVKGYARIFPIAKPRALLFQGLLDWLDGRTDRAHTVWGKSLACAQELGMPFQQGLVHYEIGRHLTGNQVSISGLTREEHLARAFELFSNLGTAYELDRVNQELDRPILT